MTTVHVCPTRDIVCGNTPANWCAECPHSAPAGCPTWSGDCASNGCHGACFATAAQAPSEAQKPIGFMFQAAIQALAETKSELVFHTTFAGADVPVYANPAPEPEAPAGLTDERIRDAFMTTNTAAFDKTFVAFREGVRFAERAHGITEPSAEGGE